MNFNGVQRHYDKLSPRERFAAMAAALARGDSTEAERLAGSSPSVAMEVPSHVILAWAALLQTSVSANELLAEIVVFSRAVMAGLLAVRRPEDTEAVEAASRWQAAAGEAARRFIARRRAFETVMGEFGFDPNALLALTTSAALPILDGFGTPGEAAAGWVAEPGADGGGEAESDLVEKLAAPIRAFLGMAIKA